MQTLSDHALTSTSLDSLLAREALYRFLGAALCEPGDERLNVVFDLSYREWLHEACSLLRAEAESTPMPLGFGELPAQDLHFGPVFAAADEGPAALAAEHQRVFGLTQSRECPPFETEYHANREPFFRSQQMADVAGFYRAFGLLHGQRQPERPDHLALELEFMAFLLMKQRLAEEGPEADSDAAAVCADAQRTFFRDHLSWWLPAFATGLRRKAEQDYYAALACAIAAFTPLERARLGVDPPRFPLQPVSTAEPEERTSCGGCAATSVSPAYSTPSM
jgi:TorA maturation chaperone TorD